MAPLFFFFLLGVEVGGGGRMGGSEVGLAGPVAQLIDGSKVRSATNDWGQIINKTVMPLSFSVASATMRLATNSLKMLGIYINNVSGLTPAQVKEDDALPTTALGCF